MRIAWSLGPALLLASCVGGTPPDASNVGSWRIEQRPDRITGAAGATATVGKQVIDPQTLATHQTLLQLMCFEGGPIVRFATDVNIGDANSSTLSYRFDDKPGHPNVTINLIGREVKVIVIEDRREVAQFLEEMATSSVLHVDISSLTKGRLRVDYPVTGAPAAIEASYAACPVGSEKPRAPRVAAKKR